MEQRKELMFNRYKVQADYFKLLIIDYTDKELSDDELDRLYNCMNEAYLHDHGSIPLWALAQAVLEMEDPTDKYELLGYALSLIL